MNEQTHTEHRKDAHAAIWSLFVAGDGNRSTSYEGALIKCAKCDGWEGLECPRGCGVVIFSNQAERDAKCRQELAEQAAERKAWRDEVRARRKDSTTADRSTR